MQIGLGAGGHSPHALLAALLVALPWAHVAEGADADGEPSRPPNIVFIFSDDHAVQAIGAYGSQINKTPNIDRLAESGYIFTQSFCTNSICGPSRACVLTGKHSHKNGLRTNRDGPFDGTQTTLPKLLRRADYRTALIGKWHLKSTPTGFDHWEILQGQGHYYNPAFLTADPAGGVPIKKQERGYCTDLITDKAIAWLESHDGTEPFFLMCQHKAPHRTWAPPLRYLNRYQNDRIKEPATLFDDYRGRSDLLKANAMSIAGHFHYAYDLKVHGPVAFADESELRYQDIEYARMDEEQRHAWDTAYEPRNERLLSNPPSGEALIRWKYQRYVKNYLRCVDAVDDSVGRLLDYLDDKDLADQTIVIYSSDQGFYLGEHGWYDKRWMFEESLRMPLIIRWPGMPAEGTRCDSLVQNIDYAPTLLEAAGLPIPDEMQGKSLALLLKQRSDSWREAVYYHYYEGGGEHNVPRHDGVRTHRYKLMHFYDDDEFNLFDLAEDPLELRSVHEKDTYADVFAEMKKKLEDLRDHYEVPTAPMP